MWCVCSSTWQAIEFPGLWSWYSILYHDTWYAVLWCNIISLCWWCYWWCTHPSLCSCPLMQEWKSRPRFLSDWNTQMQRPNYSQWWIYSTSLCLRVSKQLLTVACNDCWLVFTVMPAKLMWHYWSLLHPGSVMILLCTILHTISLAIQLWCSSFCLRAHSIPIYSIYA